MIFFIICLSNVNVYRSINTSITHKMKQASHQSPRQHKVGVTVQEFHERRAFITNICDVALWDVLRARILCSTMSKSRSLTSYFKLVLLFSFILWPFYHCLALPLSPFSCSSTLSIPAGPHDDWAGWKTLLLQHPPNCYIQLHLRSAAQWCGREGTSGACSPRFSRISLASLGRRDRY